MNGCFRFPCRNNFTENPKSFAYFATPKGLFHKIQVANRLQLRGTSALSWPLLCQSPEGHSKPITTVPKQGSAGLWPVTAGFGTGVAQLYISLNVSTQINGEAWRRPG